MPQAVAQVANGLKEMAMRMIMEHMARAQHAGKHPPVDPRAQALQQFLQMQQQGLGGPQGPQGPPNPGNMQQFLGQGGPTGPLQTGPQMAGQQAAPAQPNLMDIFRQIFGNRPDMPELRD